MCAERNDGYRPFYHFTPETNWMNDPNGLVFFEGEYHLFYQYHPGGNLWGPMHWGHAVSRDLHGWEHLPVALGPDRLGAIFSGSAVVDWHDTTGFFGGGAGLAAIFTHHADAVPGAGPVRESQSLAYSRDAGLTWVKYEGNPVLADEREPDFRDPKVFWHERSGKWIMCLAVHDRIRFYSSPDLKQWTLESAFGQGAGSHHGVWECPDLFELAVEGEPGRTLWVLIVSIGSSEAQAAGSRTQYWIGQFDGSAFTPLPDREPVRWLDHGRDNYAGVSWSDLPREDGRRIYIGWMSNWKYAHLTPTGEWRGVMTLPRELRLVRGPEGISLRQQPVRELQAWRAAVREWSNQLMDERMSNLLEGIRLAAFEIVAAVEAETAESFGFKVRAGGEQETAIGYSFTEERLFVDRTRSGDVGFHPDFPGRVTAVVPLDGGRIQVRVLVDACSVEVFAQDGRVAITDLIFPDAGSLGLELFVIGGRVRIVDLQVNEIKAGFGR